MDMITLKQDQLDVDTYLALRAGVNWKPLKREQAKKALANSLCIITAYQNGHCVGMGRLVGDGAVICYVQDLIVLPEAQGQGVGTAVLCRLKEYAERIQMEDTELMLCLMCAKGREIFYEKNGFLARPTETLGPGMIQYMRKQNEH